jgi:hypothetical protein
VLPKLHIKVIEFSALGSECLIEKRRPTENKAIRRTGFQAKPGLFSI